jgi:hypothetical protein
MSKSFYEERGYGYSCGSTTPAGINAMSRHHLLIDANAGQNQRAAGRHLGKLQSVGFVSCDLSQGGILRFDLR